jgi:2-C-methyl-D-erythritol 4-phosphate cytidylyltransferase
MGGTRKQFRLLGDQPLLVQTLRVFDRHPRVARIVVAVPPPDVELVRSLLFNAPLLDAPAVVPGGESRSLSVQAGLAALDSSIDIVLIHDAVRPFLAPRFIDAVIDAAAEHGGASLTIPVADSLRRSADGWFGEPVERSDAFQVQTPQGFRRELLQDAMNRAASSRQAEYTDDASMAIAAGYPVHMVAGSTFNYKITTEEDWRMASLLWKPWNEAEGGS